MATITKIQNEDKPELPPLTNGRKSKRSVGYAQDLHPKSVSMKEIGAETLIRAFRIMLTARRLDEKMLILLKQGKGYFHIGGSGHEAIQAAIGLQMQIGHDWANIYYRDLALSLSMGIQVRDVLVHHFAKATDPFSGGRQMSEHFTSRELNIPVPSAEVGSQFLPATGIAMAQKMLQKDSFAYVGCGDGATSQGSFFEALNWAARVGAPVLFTVQDNKYAISVPVTDQTAGGSAYKIAAGFEGMARIEVDGTDFVKSWAAVKAAIEHMRSGAGPVLLLAHTVRLLPHSSSDNQEKYRPSYEIDEERRSDPITRLEIQLIEAGVLTGRQAEEIRKEVYTEIDALAIDASKEPDPDPATLEKHVFFEGDLHVEGRSSPRSPARPPSWRAQDRRPIGCAARPCRFPASQNSCRTFAGRAHRARPHTRPGGRHW